MKKKEEREDRKKEEREEWKERKFFQDLSLRIFLSPQSHLSVLPFDSAISSFSLLLFSNLSLLGFLLSLLPPCLISGGAFGSKGMLSTSWM